MTGFVGNIEEKTRKNEFFRQVLFTSQHTQLVVMSIVPRGEIGTEVHAVTDQFLRIESGVGKLIMDGQEHEVRDGDAFVVPAGTEHNVINISDTQPLKLYTLYSPPHHVDGTIHKTKEDADSDTSDHL